VKITRGTSSSLRESPSWTAGGLHHHAAARGPDGTRGFAGAARAASAAKALAAARAELATARALAPADARARALLDSTRYSNDSIVYEIAAGPDGALRPREVPPRSHLQLPPSSSTSTGPRQTPRQWWEGVGLRPQRRAEPTTPLEPQQPHQDEKWRPSRQSTRSTPAAHSPPKPGPGYTGLTLGDGHTCVRSYTGHFLARKIVLIE
jgi:hypothetical protein